jgi:transcriptional accessory protein Tex/SPT6
MDAMDLENFAMELDRKNKRKKRTVLYSIRDEINHGYRDSRDPYRDYSPEELYNMLSATESPDQLRVGQLVTGIVIDVRDRCVKFHRDFVDISQDDTVSPGQQFGRSHHAEQRERQWKAHQ